MRNRIAAAVAALAVAAGLGCAPGKATIKSVRREGYDQKMGKTLLYVESPRLPADLVKAFKESLQKELALRGAESRFAVVAGQLSVDKAPPIEKQAADFGADLVLAITPAGGGIVNAYGGVVLLKLDAQLHDLKLGKMVWRATVDYTPGASEVAVEYRAEILTYEFIAALVSDGLLKGPLPARPEPPQPPRNPNAAIN